MQSLALLQRPCEKYQPTCQLFVQFEGRMMHRSHIRPDIAPTVMLLCVGHPNSSAPNDGHHIKLLPIKPFVYAAPRCCGSRVEDGVLVVVLLQRLAHNRHSDGQIIEFEFKFPCGHTHRVVCSRSRTAMLRCPSLRRPVDGDRKHYVSHQSI